MSLLTYTENHGATQRLEALRWVEHLPGFVVCRTLPPSSRPVCVHRSDLRWDGKPILATAEVEALFVFHQNPMDGFIQEVQAS